MPWREVSIMSQRWEFVRLAQAEGSTMAELCRRFGISRTTGYKWLKRFQASQQPGLEDVSRRPHHSPNRTSQELEEAVLRVRDAHPAWGARKLSKWLERQGQRALPSTIQAILKRHGRILPEQSAQHRPFQRFQRSQPNELWQMDFKGHFPTTQGRCYPLTILDDYSRFAIALQACPDERGETVQERLSAAFRCYGLPLALLVDNGNPWGTQGQPCYSSLQVWLMRLGIKVYHGRPFHPQTQGKEERFHRTLMAEVIRGRLFAGLAHCQRTFDDWRQVYNWERPHQALGLEVPGSRYRVSPRPFPEVLPAIEYGPEDVVRKVQDKGEISFHNLTFQVGGAFRGLPVALRPTLEDGVWEVYFMTHPIARIDLTCPQDQG